MDGIDPEKMIVYEIDGDFWHGNPAIYDADDIHPITGKRFGDLYAKTIERQGLI